MTRPFAAFLAALLAAPLAVVPRPARGLPCGARLCRCVSAAAYGISEDALTTRRRDAAAAVFVGAVVRLDTLAAPAGPAAVAKDQADAPPVRIGPVVARLRVERVWKGIEGDTATITLRGAHGAASSCDLTMQPGERYVVFAHRDEAGGLRTRQCTGTAPADAAEAALAALGDGRAPRR